MKWNFIILFSEWGFEWRSAKTHKMSNFKYEKRAGKGWLQGLVWEMQAPSDGLLTITIKSFTASKFKRVCPWSRCRVVLNAFFFQHQLNCPFQWWIRDTCNGLGEFVKARYFIIECLWEPWEESYKDRVKHPFINVTLRQQKKFWMLLFTYLTWDGMAYGCVWSLWTIICYSLLFDPVFARKKKLLQILFKNLTLFLQYKPIDVNRCARNVSIELCLFYDLLQVRSSLHRTRPSFYRPHQQEGYLPGVH